MHAPRGLARVARAPHDATAHSARRGGVDVASLVLVSSRSVHRLFMAALGGVYLIAFRSLAAQVRGLYGSRGIRPIRTYLDALRPRLRGRDQLRYVPSVFWFDASDATLVTACRAGQAGAVLLIAGVAPRKTAAALWALYLSFVSAGRELLSYQWDALLLENGLHAILIAPSRRGERPSRTGAVLMRWLAFRLQFESGHCKLASGDPTWRSGHACCVHFETQPLPTRLGWHVHQLSPRMKKLGTYATLAIELGAPWLAWAPRRFRRVAFGLLTGLQVAIAGTGNYGFFNVLTIADNLWLLDDDARGVHPRGWARVVTWLGAVPLLAMSASQLAARLFPRTRMPRSVARLHEATAPLHASNSYGLFAMMTTDRPEIVVEGSTDGVTWREYDFKYKPGDVTRPPRWVAPHMPRLDWQMWFAALGPAPPWFARFLERLLQGSPDVLALLENNPFPDRPPRYVRALLYDYHMTDRATRRRTGAWWRRELLGMYVPPLELVDGRDVAR